MGGLSALQWGGLTSKEVRSSGCSWHGVGWAEARLQIWTTEVSLSRTLLWGGECLVENQQPLRGVTPPPSLNPPQSCDRKPSCFQIVWFRWLPHKQPIEASEKFSVKWPILIDILEVRDRKYGIHRPSIIMDVWSQEARVETVWDGPAWDSQCYTHYTVGQSEEGRLSHTWIL